MGHFLAFRCIFSFFFFVAIIFLFVLVSSCDQRYSESSSQIAHVISSVAIKLATNVFFTFPFSPQIVLLVVGGVFNFERLRREVDGEARTSPLLYFCFSLLFFLIPFSSKALGFVFFLDGLLFLCSSFVGTR